MNIDVFQPTFIIEIEGHRLSKDITHEITSFVFEDNEAEMDLMEITVTDRNLQFVDDPLFQEGNEIAARFGYVDNLSPKKVAVIKEIDYDFPDGGDPTIQLKAYDKGHRLAGRQIQRVWQKHVLSSVEGPAPGILYSEIAEKIASEHGLTPMVTKTVGRHLRVAQGNMSDAQFLKQLAAKSRDKDGKGVTGYVFYIQNNELHFHPRHLEKRPALTLEYFTDREGVLRSFKPSTQSQGVKGAGTETKAVGVDPRKKKSVEHAANNATTSDRTSLGKKTYLVDGNTGDGKFRKQESGKIAPSYERSESFHEDPRQEPAQDRAESRFKDAELRQVEATAVTVGIPTLVAKQNIEVRGVGRKFSGIYYCTSVRHIFGDGYSCELKLKRNALGKGAGAKSAETSGKKNEQTAPKHPKRASASGLKQSKQATSPRPVRSRPKMIRVDANSGQVINS
ncbi:MAG: phage late control D family protein [Armatimonadota bacterium]